MRFFKCLVCGKIIAIVNDRDVPTICCGKEMVELIPNTQDGAKEKHVPVYEIKGDKLFVTVGSTEHPMIPEHYIEWISVQTSSGNQRKALKPGDPPKACFALLDGDEIEAVYAYCNLHSLWKSK